MGTPELIYTYCSVNGTDTATKLPDVDTPRIRWYQTNTNDGSCSKETQVRVRTAEGKWGEWSGSYVYSTCADYQTSTRYKYPLSENAACETAVARRQRKDGAEWTPWQSEYNYTTCKGVVVPRLYRYGVVRLEAKHVRRVVDDRDLRQVPSQ